MTQNEFIKLAESIVYIKKSNLTIYGGNKLELKGLKELYKAINLTVCCERCESIYETEVICIECLKDI